jgi:hypothetical protein
MSTVEQDLRTVLLGIVPTVYPDWAPLSSPKPYTVYQQIGGQVVSFLGREVPSKKNGRYQIVTWASTRQESTALALAIESALITATAFQAAPESGPVGGAEPDLGLYSTSQDFSIWSDR